MRYQAWVQINFEAGHNQPHEDFYLPHGHLYRVRAIADGTYDPNGAPPIDYLRTALAEIRREFHGRPIDQMMSAAMTTPAGIAAYFLDRLQLASAIQVQVGEDSAVTMRRT